MAFSFTKLLQLRYPQSDKIVLPATLLGPPLGGSYITTFIWLGMGTGVLSAAVKGFRLNLPRNVLIAGFAFVFFFAAELLSAIINFNGMTSFLEVMENLPFLAVIPLYGLLCAQRDELALVMLRVAPWVGIAAFAYAALQLWWLGYRPQGSAGNPAIFAMTTGIVYGMSMAALMLDREGNRFIAIAGFVLAGAAVILSGSRAIWLVIPLTPIVLLIANRTALRLPSWKLTAAALIALIIMSILVQPYVTRRIQQGFGDVARHEQGQLATSYGKRIEIWKIAIPAIAERPIFGHGPDSPARIIQERIETIPARLVAFSHFHNAIINEMIRAGIVGTIALIGLFAVPLWAVLRAPADLGRQTGLLFLLSLQTSWLAGGTVNIMLDHDITDAVFAGVTTAALYLAYGNPCDEVKEDENKTLTSETKS